jgi:hypothetical protein
VVLRAFALWAAGIQIVGHDDDRRLLGTGDADLHPPDRRR